MKKAVLISIQPKWVEKIVNEEKTVEVRKTRPKIETPFKCYIYCTKPRYDHEDFIVLNAGTENAFAFYGGGKVIGEFVCDRIEKWKWFDGYVGYCYDGQFFAPIQPTLNNVGLTFKELKDYGKGEPLYGWHISELKVYDKPKELSEFMLAEYNYGKIHCPPRQITRPPQSWCYCYVKE